jgi:hypothetical protein
LSENNLLANFKKISKEINENNLSMLMRKSNSEHSNEIIISNTGADDDDNYDNFFIAIAERGSE